MIWHLNANLHLNLSYAKDFRNLNYMVTWCINWRRLLALIIFQRSSLKQFPIIKRLAIILMYCNRLHAWWSTQSRLATLLSSLIARRWVGLQTLWRFRHETGLSPPVKYFTDRSKAVLHLWIFLCFFSILCLLCLCARLFIFALWSPAGGGVTSWLSFVVSYC